MIRIDLLKFETFGRSFLYDFVVNEYNNKRLDSEYKRYIADCLCIQASFYAGKVLPSWTDIVESMKKSKNEQKSGKEVINRMKTKFKKWLEGDEEE